MLILSTNKRKGITLIELLVVLIISGAICSAVGYILYSEALRLEALRNREPDQTYG